MIQDIYFPDLKVFFDSRQILPQSKGRLWLSLKSTVRLRGLVGACLAFQISATAAAVEAEPLPDGIPLVGFPEIRRKKCQLIEYKLN